MATVKRIICDKCAIEVEEKNVVKTWLILGSHDDPANGRPIEDLEFFDLCPKCAERFLTYLNRKYLNHCLSYPDMQKIKQNFFLDKR